MVVSAAVSELAPLLGCAFICCCCCCCCCSNLIMPLLSPAGSDCATPPSPASAASAPPPPPAAAPPPASPPSPLGSKNPVLRSIALRARSRSRLRPAEGEAPLTLKVKSSWRVSWCGGTKVAGTSRGGAAEAGSPSAGFQRGMAMGTDEPCLVWGCVGRGGGRRGGVSEGVQVSSWTQRAERKRSTCPKGSEGMTNQQTHHLHCRRARGHAGGNPRKAADARAVQSKEVPICRCRRVIVDARPQRAALDAPALDGACDA